MPHRIQLRGPWEYELAAASKSCGDIALPAQWAEMLPAAYSGGVLLRRRFGRPTGLDVASRVVLVVAAGGLRGTAVLNDETLGELRENAVESCFEITRRLLPRNELRLVFAELPRELGAESKPLPDVRLEIDSPADQ